MKTTHRTIAGTDSKRDCLVGSRAVSILLPHWTAAPRSDSPEVFRMDTKGFLHPGQNILKATQKCRAVNRRRGRCACKASSCRRRAKFSRTRSSRERKELTIHPRRCRSDGIIARILSELSEFSFSPSHSFIHFAGVRGLAGHRLIFCGLFDFC